jgi:glycolate oxidase
VCFRGAHLSRARRDRRASGPGCRGAGGVLARLPEVVERINQVAEEHGLRVANILHAGDGNLHPNLCFDARDPDTLERVRRLGAEILRICVEAGGVLSGEHGIGVEKRDYMPLLYAEEDLEAMRWLHEAFDPEDRCNPGKLIPAPRACMESNPRHRGYDLVRL